MQNYLEKILLLLLMFSASAFSQYEWRHDEDIAYVRPIAQGPGFIRDIRGVTGNGVAIHIVHGNVDLTIESRGQNFVLPFPSNGKYEFFLNRPNGNGENTLTSISNILTGVDTITWNSNTVPDGDYVISVRLYSAGTTSETDISRFRTRPLLIIVDNDGSPETGPQWIPLTGYATTRYRNYDGIGVDWIWYPGWSQPNITPYPYTIVTPPSDPASRAILSDYTNDDWFVETLWGVFNSRHDEEPLFAHTREGHVVEVGTDFAFVNDKKSKAVDAFLTDGARNQSGAIPQTSLTANLRGKGIVGAARDDRVFFAGPDRITTIAGYVTRQDAIPCIPNDCDDPTLFAQKNLIGNFQNNELFGFEKRSELVFDTNNNNKIYVSDTRNHRIALLEVNGCDENYQNYNSGYPKISTFAGQYGVAGYQDGSLLLARFDQPMGMAIVGRTLYVADYGNNVIRAIDLDNGVVSTLSTQTSFIDPEIVRRDSQGNLFVKSGTGSGDSNFLYHLNVQTGDVDSLGEVGHVGTGMDVDWRGNFGNIDDIIFGGEKNGHFVGRLSFNGTSRVRVLDDSGFPLYYDDSMGAGQGSYPLEVAIDDEEARLYISPTYRERPIVIRPLQASDPVNINRTISQRGLYILHYGTIPEFNPNWQRSSFDCMFGSNGHHWLGNTIPTFDELALMSDLELADYIKNGMAGHVERPEITGKDLQAFIYFIKVLSVSGKSQEYNPETIKQNLAGTEYWPDVNDDTPPTISNINVADLGNGTMQVTWTTNEPTLGVISYGTNAATITYWGPVQEDYYGLFSEIESTYSTQHSLSIENVPYNQQMKFKIISKDKAGNIGKSGEMLFGSPDTSPPSNPSGLNANPISESQIDLAWNASSDPESGIANYNVYRDNILVAQPSGTTYSDIGLNENTTYSYEVSAVNGAGLESGRSPSVNATTGMDETPPTIISAGIGQSLSEVYVKYSEPVEENSATNINNYGIDNGISISSASLAADLKTVNVSTSPHTLGMSYILTVNNVRDRASNPNTIANDTHVNYVADDTTNADVTPPTIVSAGIGQNLSVVRVKYSEPVEENSATNVNNYGINNAISILSASLATDQRTVNLNTSPHTPGMNYILTVNNILDLASIPNAIANNTQVPYTATDTTSGQAGAMNLTVISGKPYEVVTGLNNGDKAYIDRNYVYGGLPDSLTGDNTIYILTANGDKLSQENPFLTFDISETLTIYIAHDDRYQIKPDWMMTGDFRNTGQSITIDGAPHTLFKKTFPAGTVTLGGNINPAEPETNDMYTVILGQPKGGNPPPGNDPSTYTLSQNYPNPFNPSTQIAYELERDGRVELKVFDLLGREVAVLVDRIQTQGKHIAEFNGEGLSSGFYFYRIQSGDFVEAKMMTMRK